MTTIQQTTDTRKQRNVNIEIFRFSLMVAILIWHLLVHGLDYKNMGEETFVPSISHWLSALIITITIPAVNCFMLISGFFRIKFNIKKYVTLVLSLILTYSFCIISRHFLFDYPIGVNNILSMCFPVGHNAWWFMTVYLTIFIFSPIINAGCDAINKKQHFIMLSFLIVLSSLSLTRFVPHFGSSFLSLLIVYLIGITLSKYPPRLGLTNILLITFTCALGIFLMSFVLLHGGPLVRKGLFVLLSYNNPLIVLYATGIFMIVLNLRRRENKILQSILKYNLYIYLITECIGCKILYAPIAHLFLEGEYLTGICAIIGTLFGCLLIGYVINKAANSCYAILEKAFMKNSLLYRCNFRYFGNNRI